MRKPALASTVLSDRVWSRLAEVVVCAVVLALFYGVVTVAGTWLGPFTPAAAISRSPAALPRYAAYSLLRIAVAYLLSLVFAVGYGYLAAYRPAAERVMIPLLDILQSVPVLGFLVVIVSAFLALFPHSYLGVELASVCSPSSQRRHGT